MKALQVSGVMFPGVRPAQAGIAPLQAAVAPAQTTTGIDLNSIVNLMMVIMVIKMLMGVMTGMGKTA